LLSHIFTLKQGNEHSITRAPQHQSVATLDKAIYQYNTTRNRMFTRSWFYALAVAQLAIGANASFFTSSVPSPEEAHQNLDKLKVIIYETGPYSTSLQTFMDVADKYGLEAVVVGQGSTFSGFGSKYGQLKDSLNELSHDPKALVAVIDGRDVLLNINRDVERNAFEGRINEFIGSFKELVAGKPEAVLMSAEQQCCVAALCHADSPAYYFDPVTKMRTNRACPSGEDGCGWLDNENVKFWQSLMVAEAYQHTGSQEISPFLNAGLMVGTANNLIDMIERMDLGEEEDDQAVLSAMYLQFPELIVLDYEQQLLGNNAWPKGLEDGCIYDFDVNMTDKLYLTNTQTGTSPLILHTPGKFYSCLDTLIDRLGGESDKRFLPERQLKKGDKGNYGPGGDRSSNYRSNYASNYGNYGTILTETEPATPAPVVDDSGMDDLEDLTRVFEEAEEDDDSGSNVLTWGLSCAAAGVLIAGLATRRRQTMTQEQHDNIQRALNDSDEAFALGGDPRLDDAVSVISSAVDEAADPDSLDLAEMSHQPLGTVDEHNAMVDVPVDGEEDRQMKSILSVGDCDEICGTKQSTEDLRRNRTVHW